MAFSYSTGELDALDVSLSKDRLDRYLRMVRQDRKKAIQFYEMNNVVSESFFGVIRGLEVALRNAYHRQFTNAAHGRQDWYDHFFTQFDVLEQDSINEAKKKIKARGDKETPGRIVALLGMGFWCGLTGRPYDAPFWVPFLHKAFAHKRLGRKDAWERLGQIRAIRNRIAHHESILHLDISKEHETVLETIGWICPITRSWVEHTTTLPTKLKDLANAIADEKKLAADEKKAAAAPIPKQ